MQVALRLHEPDRLEPSQMRVVGPDLPRLGPGWMTMTGTTQLQQRLGGPFVRTEGERELGLRGASSSCDDVSPARPVATFARDVGDHDCLVNLLVAAGCNLGRMTAETLACGVGRGLKPVWRDSRRPPISTLAGCQAERILPGVVSESVLDDRWDRGIEQAHECCGMVARSKRVVGDPTFDAVGCLSLDQEPSLSELVCPGDLRPFGINNRRPIQRAGQTPPTRWA